MSRLAPSGAVLQQTNSSHGGIKNGFSPPSLTALINYQQPIFLATITLVMPINSPWNISALR